MAVETANNKEIMEQGKNNQEDPEEYNIEKTLTEEQKKIVQECREQVLQSNISAIELSDKVLMAKGSDEEVWNWLQGTAMQWAEQQLSKWRDPEMEKQLFTDQFMRGTSMVHVNEEGNQTRVVPGSEQWEETLRKMREKLPPVPVNPTEKGELNADWEKAISTWGHQEYKIVYGEPRSYLIEPDNTIATNSVQVPPSEGHLEYLYQIIATLEKEQKQREERILSWATKCNRDPAYMEHMDIQVHTMGNTDKPIEDGKDSK